MQCPKCGLENRGNARFCGRCGYTLPEAAATPPPTPPAPPRSERTPQGIPTAHACPVCNTALKPGARFCARCGTPVAEPSPVNPSVASSTWSASPPTAAVAAAQPVHPTAQAPPSEAAWQSYAPSPLNSGEPLPVRRQAGGRFAWLLALLALLVSGCCVFSTVVGLGVGSAFGGTVAAPPEVDPSRPDLTLYVSEAYVTAMLDGVMPGSIPGETELDVQPGNRLELTSRFDLLVFRLEVVIVSRLSVVDGRIEIAIVEVDPGAGNVLELIGVDEWTLGEELVDTVQQGLEKELGAGSQLLDIRTDETWIILEARLN